MWDEELVKTTLNLPEPLWRRAKTTAAREGQTLGEFITAATQEKLASQRHPRATNGGWRSVFGKISRRQAMCVDAIIHAEFSKIDPADWR
jgi:hypothetical protein